MAIFTCNTCGSDETIDAGICGVCAFDTFQITAAEFIAYATEIGLDVPADVVAEATQDSETEKTS